MKKLTSLFIASLFIFSSCGKIVEDIVIVEKKPFLIETQILSKKTESYTIDKSARITAGSSLTLSAESAGEVVFLSAKEGQKIKKGTRLVSLRDTVNSYDIRLRQAENGLTVQDASIEATKLSLERAILDTQIGYDQAKRTYDTMVSKNTLIYDTLVNSNQKTLDSYNENYKTYLGGIEGTMSNFLYEGDKILGMTSAFQYNVDGWKAYLGAKVGNTRADAQNAWNKLYSNRGDIRAKKDTGGNLTIRTLANDLDIITSAYAQTQIYVDAMIYMLQNDVIGGGLSQTMQDGWLATWNGIKSQIQASEGGYNTWKSQTQNFFKTYQNTEKATELAITSLSRELTPEEKSLLATSSDMSITYKNTLVDLRDRLKGAELALRQAQNARDSALKSRGVTLTQLSATRNGTALSVEQAQREYSKLSIVAPFDGTITKVIGAVGQRTSIGTPMLEIVSNTPEILVDLDNDIATTLSISDTVSVKVEGKIFTGTVTAISRAANTNLLYTARISISDALRYIGSAATLSFQGSREAVSPRGIAASIILPLKSIKIISEQEGEIAFLSTGNTIRYKSVKLGKIAGENIEILDTLDPKGEIIITDVSNFDPSKYILTKKASK